MRSTAGGPSETRTNRANPTPGNPLPSRGLAHTNRDSNHDNRQGRVRAEFPGLAFRARSQTVPVTMTVTITQQLSSKYYPANYGDKAISLRADSQGEMFLPELRDHQEGQSRRKSNAFQLYRRI